MSVSEPSPPGDPVARENAYLRKRNLQLQDDVIGLESELARLRQVLERLHGRTPAAAPNPLAGGQ